MLISVAVSGLFLPLVASQAFYACRFSTKSDCNWAFADESSIILASDQVILNGSNIAWSEVFQISKTETDHHAFGIVCVSFSAQASHWTRAGLFLVNYLNDSKPLVDFSKPDNIHANDYVRLLWNVDASPDDSWTTYHLSARVKWRNDDSGLGVFQLVFVTSASLTENHVNDEWRHVGTDGIHLAVGIFELESGNCQRDVVNEDLHRMHKRVGEMTFYQSEDATGEERMPFSSGLLWPGAIIPFEFADGYFNRTQKSMIRTAMLDIANRSCIRFVPHLHSNSFVEFLGESMGCFSFVGYTGGYAYTNLDTSTCFDMRTIRHELLHLIGFFHEHQRPDRDMFIDVLWENVRPTAASQFDVKLPEEIQLLEFPYDYESVMHYGTKTFSKDGSQTIRPKFPWATIGAIQTFSPIDTAKMRKLYSCENVAMRSSWGSFCAEGAGEFRCVRYSPCEFGVLECPRGTLYDSIERTCKVSRKLGESCDVKVDRCAPINSECDNSTEKCKCQSGYYEGSRGDCLRARTTKRLNELCSGAVDCLYELICDMANKTCRCPHFQNPIGHEKCVDKTLGESCGTNSDCYLAIPASRCINGTCDCPPGTEADVYIDVRGNRRRACSRQSVEKMDPGSECDVTAGRLCASGGICQFCPDSTMEICTINREFAAAWGNFPDKPPDFYFLAGKATPSVPTSSLLAVCMLALINVIKISNSTLFWPLN